MGTPLCSLPPSVNPSPSPSLLPSSPLPPPSLYLDCSPFHFILSPSLLQVLSLSFHFTCIFSTDIHPFIPDAERLELFFTTYLTIIENATLHTASSQPPDTTHDSSGHIFLSKIYSITDFTGTNIHSKHKMKAVWCDVLPVGVHYSSVQTRPLCS